jgi:hypothetical protein
MRRLSAAGCTPSAFEEAAAKSSFSLMPSTGTSQTPYAAPKLSRNSSPSAA